MKSSLTDISVLKFEFGEKYIWGIVVFFPIIHLRSVGLIYFSDYFT